MPENERYIVHVDMDAFFASVEQRENPEYLKKPVIVGADPKKGKGRGVVAACSYEARSFGIHSAMPISIAYKKCPGGIFVPPDMKKYADYSHRIFTILERFTPDIEPVSIDEGFLDITGSWHLFGSPKHTCILIKESIKKETGLTASTGMAPNKMTAKIASDLNKPDGAVIVSRKTLRSFLDPLPVAKLWGVGVKTKSDLEKMGINTIGDLASKPVSYLDDIFGKNGAHIWELANGIDPRRVEPRENEKSISNEQTFEQDTRDKDLIMDVLMRLSEKVSLRLRKEGLKGRTVTLKLRTGDFKTYTRSITIDPATNFSNRIYKNVLERAETFDLEKTDIRLVGVKVSNFSDTFRNHDLFRDDTHICSREENIHKAVDRIVEKYGEDAIRRRG